MTIYAGMGRMTEPSNKIKIEVDNECLDALVLGALKRTRAMLLRKDKQYAPGSDDRHVVYACETLIRWYGHCDEDFDEEKSRA